MSDFKSGTLGRLSGEREKKKERKEGRGKGERWESEKKRGRKGRWERGINCSDTLRNLYTRQPGKLIMR